MSSVASGSTLASPVPFPVHQAPENVVKDLELARDPSTASDETWTEATESSLLWLLSLVKPDLNVVETVVDQKGKGKELECERLVHWFCGKEGAGECWESALFLIRLLRFKSDGEVGKWRAQYDRYVVVPSSRWKPWDGRGTMVTELMRPYLQTSVELLPLREGA